MITDCTSAVKRTSKEIPLKYPHSNNHSLKSCDVHTKNIYINKHNNKIPKLFLNMQIKCHASEVLNAFKLKHSQKDESIRIFYVFHSDKNIYWQSGHKIFVYLN